MRLRAGLGILDKKGGTRLPNVEDHALAVGGQSLAERPFDALDSLILTQLVYMPMEGLLNRGESCRVAQAWAFLKEHCDYERLDVFQQKRYRLAQTCAGLARYRDWRMHDYQNHIDYEREMQFCACAFELPGGLSVVAFRGTDLTLVGWKEDLNMSFMTVPSQQEAAEYVDRIARQNGDALYLCGHSKGGNLAVHAAARASAPVRERIRRIDNFDGPGVDEETLHSYGYAMIQERIVSYIPQSSVVGMLLNYHPAYTVVRAHSLGLLQHDAMTWQVVNGDFVRQASVDLTGKMTDEAVHAWLATMDMDERKLLVDTLYQVVSASQAELVTDLLEDWRDAAGRMLEAIRGLEPQVKRNVRRMLRSLFSTGTAELLRLLLPSAAEAFKPPRS